jgi:hypothetical protein
MQGKSDPNGELLDAAALCRHLVADGSVYAFLADDCRELFADELFADVFPSGRGRPSVPADVVATVMVLQALKVCRTETRRRCCGPTSRGRWRRAWRWMMRGSTTRC